MSHTALARYEQAMRDWHTARADSERAARQRAWALADLAATGLTDIEIADRVRLSPKRVRELITKAHQEDQ